ncbi:MAG: RluA family pseudouridine synthase [Gemmatimonadetes bacterium]|nr:RluA family pseudouridine synthase [Gemmatimonadota bacterium]
MDEAPEAAASRRCTVAPAQAGARLDALVAQLLPELSRSRAAALLEEGAVRLNGCIPRKSTRPVAGDVIEILLPAVRPAAVLPEDIPLRICYEDPDLLVIDKPAGLVVHPAPGHAQGTLVNALLHHVADLSGIGGVLRPGIVHRLDRDTSGLLLVAKHDEAHRALSLALRQRRIRRVYLAAAWGHLRTDAVRVEAPIARSPAQRQRMAVVASGRAAATRFQRLERWRAAELLRAELETGRTHQIRVHLAHIGHPVVGDPLYGPARPPGSGPDRGWAVQLAKRVPRQYLLAAQLHFTHPRTGAALSFESALPDVLAEAAAWARETSLPV